MRLCFLIVSFVCLFAGCKRKRDPNNSSATVTATFGDMVQQYWWRYCIRLENVGTQNVQLCERNWRIFSMNGSLETVRARGVNGVVSYFISNKWNRLSLILPPLGCYWSRKRNFRLKNFHFTSNPKLDCCERIYMRNEQLL